MPANHDRLDPRYELAFNESLRALTQQQSVLDDLRSRCGTLLAATAIATSFLGGITLGEDGRFSYWTWAAVMGFVAASALLVAVLWPRGGWEFRISHQDFLDGYVLDKDYSLTEVYNGLGSQFEDFVDENDGNLRSLFILYEAASVALSLEVIL